MKKRYLSFVGFVIMICETVIKFSKNKGFKKLFKAVLGFISMFTFVCLIYGCIISFIDIRRGESVFEKYNRKKESE